MIVLDTSFVFALLDKTESRHQEATRWYETETSPFATTPLVLVELDHLLRTRATSAAVAAFYGEVRAGSLGVEWWPALDAKAAEVAGHYAELGLGLADASLIVLAEVLETNRIATFDERHFRHVEPLGAATAFELLPADSS